MASQKKQDESRVQFLRRMVALPHNRNCFDCGQRGPTYVNMTIGSYVCTACSGILRGINPPHRVKSISMGSFSQDEVDMLTQRGNEYNRQVWLGLHDTKEPPAIEAKDEIKLRDYMSQKYERKRWYAAPTEGLAETAKVMNNQNTGTSGSSTRRPVAPNFRVQTPPAGVPKMQSTPSSIAAPQVAQAVPTPSLPRNSGTNSADLLTDMFASNATTAPAAVASSSSGAAAAPSANNFNQPDFANFSSMASNFNPAAPLPASTPSAMTSLFPSDDSEKSDVLDTPMSLSTPGSSQPVAAPASNSTQWSTLTVDPNSGGDKYASLSGLFADDMPNPQPVVSSQASVNWNSINWSGTAAVSAAPTAAPSAGQPAMSWGATASQPTQGGVFGQQPTASSSTGVNPFLVSASPAVVPQPAASFGMATQSAGQQQGFPGFPAQAPATQTNLSTGYPYQQPQVSQTNPFGGSGFNAFPNQAAANVAAPFGSAQTQGFPSQNGMNAQWGAPSQSTNHFGGSQQWGGATTTPANQWAAPPGAKPAAVNPFLTQVPGTVGAGQPPAATNPFL